MPAFRWRAPTINRCEEETEQAKELGEWVWGTGAWLKVQTGQTRGRKAPRGRVDI